MTLAFKDATLNEVLDALSSMTCVRYVVTEGVRLKPPASITLSSTTPMTAAALIDALDQDGLALLPASPGYARVVDKNRMLLAHRR